MDGIHDLGGMAGFGAIDVEPGEPVFHEAWEALAFALNALGIVVLQAYNTDEYRHAIERMEPAHYLAASYYERVLTGVATLLVEKGIVRHADLEARAAAPFPLANAPASAPSLSLPRRPGEGVQRKATANGEAEANALPPSNALPRSPGEGQGGGASADRPPSGSPPAFSAGTRVRVRDLHPRGHTRVPRYVRGRTGTVVHITPLAVFPDAAAHGLPPRSEHTYHVCFDARDLWGDAAEANQTVVVDLWETYLEFALERDAFERAPSLTLPRQPGEGVSREPLR